MRIDVFREGPPRSAAEATVRHTLSELPLRLQVACFKSAGSRFVL